MRTIAKGWAILSMICGLMMAATIANAQAPYQEPVGVESSWDISGVSGFSFDQGPTQHAAYNAAATFETIGNEYAGESEADLRTSTQLTPVSFDAVGKAGSQEDGIQFSLSADRERTEAAGLVSSVTARQPGGNFPAAAVFQFHANITLNEDPENVYVSRDPIRLTNDHINEWPLNGQPFTQAGEAVFVSVNDPSRTLTVRDLNVAVIAPPKVTSPCTDVCCQTTALTLNTGYDHGFGSVYPVGSLDQYWTITSDPFRTPVPRSANVIAKLAGVWGGPFAGTQWIGPNPTALDTRLGDVRYAKCFCLCQTSTLTFSMSVLVDDQAFIYVDGVFVGATANGAFVNPTNFNFTRTLGTGRHCVEVVVRNSQVSHSGLNIQGSIQGSGLLKYNCCGPVTVTTDPCLTNRLVLGSNNTWTLLTGPPKNGPYPRCASIVTQPNGAWGAPTAGSSWIGPNFRGTSVAGPPNTYIYRKCFCVAQAGNYAITFTTLADDYVNVRLNGAPLYTHAGFSNASRTTRTFIVALGTGCNCMDFEVVDAGYAVTGLNVLVDIQGALLYKDNCCSCSGCNTSFPPDNPPSGLSMKDGDAGTIETSIAADKMAADVAAASTARPTLVNVPGETTGQSTVHYVMDQDAQAQVKLYNAEGELVRVLDEGTREMGGHAVSLVTTDLPAGSYSVELVYAEHALTVPVDVQ